MTTLAPTLQSYFTDRLLCQQRVSPNTVASYRDAFRLLLAFIQETTGTPPSKLDLTQLDAPTIGAFLEHLEHARGNSSRTRNIRLAAIHSFFHYCALRHPEHAALIARVLAIPPKRGEKRTVTSLTTEEVQALLDAPDRTTSAGRRDHVLLLTAVQTGLRVSELLGLTRARHPAQHRRARSHDRQRTKGESRAAHDPDCGRAQGLDARRRWRSAGPVVPLPRRRIADPRCDRTSSRQARRDRPSALARR